MTADRHPRAVAVLVFACSVLSGYGQVLPVFRDALQAHFGLDAVGYGLTVSIGMGPAAAALLLAGLAVGRWGARRVLRASLIGWAAGAALIAAGQRWGVMLAGAALLSCFSNAIYIAGQLFVADLFPGRRRGVLALVLTAGHVAGILFPLVAEGLLAARDHSFATVLHGPFVAAAVLMLCAAAGFGGGTGPAPQPAVPWRGGAATWALMAAAATLGASDNAISVWMPRVLGGADLPGWMRPGIVMSAFSLSYVVSRTILAALPERVGRRALMGPPALFAGVALLAALATGSPVVLAATFVAAALVWSLQMPCLLAALTTRESGGAVSIAMSGALLFGFAMANLMGYVARETGHPWTIAVPVAGYLTAGLLAWRAGAGGPAETPPPTSTP